MRTAIQSASPSRTGGQTQSMAGWAEEPERQQGDAAAAEHHGGRGGPSLRLPGEPRRESGEGGPAEREAAQDGPGEGALGGGHDRGGDEGDGCQEPGGQSIRPPPALMGTPRRGGCADDGAEADVRDEEATSWSMRIGVVMVGSCGWGEVESVEHPRSSGLRRHRPGRLTGIASAVGWRMPVR